MLKILLSIRNFHGHKGEFMTKLYHRISCSSSQKIFLWFKKYNVSVETYTIRSITKVDLINVLSLTNEGIVEIIKQRNQSNEEVKEKLKRLEEMNFNDAIDYLLQNTDLLRTPITLDKNKYMIGYHVEEIRKFMPKEYRKRIFKIKEQNS